MQIKYNLPKYLQNPRIVTLLKVAIVLLCCLAILLRLQEESIGLLDFSWPVAANQVLFWVILLMMVNWFLEVFRWKVSLSTFEPISLTDAARAVFGGLALNWLLPFTSGDLFARIVSQKNKIQAAAAVVLNRSIMLVFTLTFGLYGSTRIAQSYGINGWYILILLFTVPFLKVFLKNQANEFLKYYKQLDKAVFVQVFFLSLIRYLVFVFQFYLLLHAFLPFLSTDLILAGIGWVFLIRSVLPLFFGGVGVREMSGILFFEPYVAHIQLVVFPIFLIWVINTVVPSIIGIFFVYKLNAANQRKNDPTHSQK